MAYSSTTASPQVVWSATTTSPVWSPKARIPRKRNRSTSANAPQLSNDVIQSADKLLQPMSRYHQQSTPAKLNQQSSSWISLTNSHPSTTSDQQQPPKKRRKGVAGTILSTALEAALFTSAIGYAAYNFWCGKDLGEEEEEATRLSPKAKFARSPISNQPLLSSPPPPPYEPPKQVLEQIRMARTPRKSTSTRSVTNHRVYSSRPVQPTSIPSDPINFILRPNSIRSINHSFLHMKDGTESIERSLNPYTYTPPPSELTKPNELDEEEYGEDDEEIKAFKAQIQGLIKEGREALASKPCLPNSITQSSSSLYPRPFNKIINQSRRTTANPHLQTIVACTDKSTQSVPQLDENIQLLQLALEKAALPSDSNWWER